MAVFFNDVDKSELVVTCGCNEVSCDNAFHIKIDKDDEDTFCFFSYLNGNYYRDQIGVFLIIKNKLKKIWDIIRNRDLYYSDVVMNKKDFQLFQEYINSIK